MRDDESSLSGQSSVEPSSLSDAEQDSVVAEDASCCTPKEETDVCPSPKDASDSAADQASFLSLRITYLIVTLVVMLADGLQGKSNTDITMI